MAFYLATLVANVQLTLDDNVFHFVKFLFQKHEIYAQ